MSYKIVLSIIFDQINLTRWVKGEYLCPNEYKYITQFYCWRLQQLEHIWEYAYRQRLIDSPRAKI